MEMRITYENETDDTVAPTTSSSSSSSSATGNKGVVPRDAEGYHLSFKLDPQDPNHPQVVSDAKAFFKKFGFVVFRDAVAKELIDAVVDDIWQNYLPAGIKRDDPLTWFQQPSETWTAKVFGGKYNAKRGFLGYDIAQSQAAWDVRQDPSLYRAFVTILEKEKLLLKMDRYGLMRPTKVRVPKQDGSAGEFEVEDHPEWKTEERWVHWDQNPWTELDFRGVQGVLALSEHNETSGGFHCVPCFAEAEFKEWGSQNSTFKTKASLVDLPKTDPAMDRVERICMRPGSLLMWDSRTPHGNYPNEGFDWRMVMYVTMDIVVDKWEDSDKAGLERDYFMTYLMKKWVNLTPLGRRLAGFVQWEDETDLLKSL